MNEALARPQGHRGLIIGPVDGAEQLQVAGAVARTGDQCQSLAVPHPQGAVDPHLSGPRLYSSGALIRGPSADQPGGGGLGVRSALSAE